MSNFTIQGSQSTSHSPNRMPSPFQEEPRPTPGLPQPEAAPATQVTPVQEPARTIEQPVQLERTPEVAPQQAAPAPVTTPPATPVAPINERVSFYEQLFGGKAPAVVEPDPIKTRLDSIDQRLTQFATPQRPAEVEVAPQPQATPAFDAAAFRQEFAQEAMEMVRAETDVRNYVNEVRSQNADMVPFEREINYIAQEYLNSAVKNGSVQNYSDYANASKAAINKAIQEMRQKLSGAYAAGRSAATTIREEVVATQAVVPQTQAAPVQQVNTTDSRPETAQDYIRRRQERYANIRHMHIPQMA